MTELLLGDCTRSQTDATGQTRRVMPARVWARKRLEAVIQNFSVKDRTRPKADNYANFRHYRLIAQ